MRCKKQLGFFDKSAMVGCQPVLSGPVTTGQAPAIILLAVRRTALCLCNREGCGGQG